MLACSGLFNDEKLLCRFTEDIYQMTGYRPGMYWQLTWRYIGPAMMSVLLVASVISMVRTSPEYGAWDPVAVKFIVLNAPS